MELQGTQGSNKEKKNLLIRLHDNLCTFFRRNFYHSICVCFCLCLGVWQMGHTHA